MFLRKVRVSKEDDRAARSPVSRDSRNPYEITVLLHHHSPRSTSTFSIFFFFLYVFMFYFFIFALSAILFLRTIARTICPP